MKLGLVPVLRALRDAYRAWRVRREEREGERVARTIRRILDAKVGRR